MFLFNRLSYFYVFIFLWVFCFGFFTVVVLVPLCPIHAFNVFFVFSSGVEISGYLNQGRTVFKYTFSKFLTLTDIRVLFGRLTGPLVFLLFLVFRIP